MSRGGIDLLNAILGGWKSCAWCGREGERNFTLIMADAKWKCTAAEACAKRQRRRLREVAPTEERDE